MTTKAAKAHKSKLAGMGCMACMRIHGPHEPGPVQLHHLRAGQGWGRGGFETLIPLCLLHHTGAEGVHGLGTRAFPRHHGFTEADLLADVNRLLLPSATKKGAE